MRRALYAAAMFLLIAGPAAAQVRAGLNEVNVNGHITRTSADDESFTMSQLQGRFGRFLSDQVELGVLASLNKFEDVDLFGDIGAFGAYHFGAMGATTVPYVGANVGFGFGNEGDNPFSYGGFGGLKFFVGPAGAVSTELFFSQTSIGDSDFNQLGARLGVSIFF